ncbi:MAG: hypothetical protein AAB388_00030 [Patescibacteria group bacterium]
MDTQIKNLLEEQSKKIDAIYSSVEKTRRYFLIIMWISIAFVVLPAIGLIFAIPAFISTYASLSGGF